MGAFDESRSALDRYRARRFPIAPPRVPRMYRGVRSFRCEVRNNARQGSVYRSVWPGWECQPMAVGESSPFLLARFTVVGSIEFDGE